MLNNGYIKGDNKMKYMKRTGIYKAANVTFDPKKIQAHSYVWWKFVDVVEGKVIFNNYRYSVTTSKHQSKVRALMNDLGIKIDIEMPLPRGISDNSLSFLIKWAEETLCDQFLEKEFKKQERYERAKFKRAEKEKQRIESLLGHTADCTELYKKLDKVNLNLVKES